MSDVLERLTTALADRYTIESEIGGGGMAVVYLAHDRKHDRHVALKVLRPDLAASIGAERFLREIEIAAKLTHPGILTLIDSGTADGLPYYVMPFVEGESLRDRLNREKQLPLEDALRITGEVAEALSSAHGEGVVHRDIKPENILLHDGHAVVADFGIAHAVTTAGGAQLTESGIAVGTAAYMSPEQAGTEKELDPRSDVYSLGCVLYEMLAGETPYTGPSDQAIMARKTLDPVPPLRHVRETVPLGVEQAVTKALAKIPTDRYATAQHFAEALAKPGVAKTLPSVPRLVSITAGVVLLTLAVGWGVRQAIGNNSNTTLDPNLVAVMPFRTAGADPSLGYLREGMMDLLAAKLTGEGGARAANPSTVMAAWRQVAPADDADVSEEQAAGVARTIGAGHLLMGSVVGTTNRLVLSATLTSTVGTGPGATQATVEGPEDSLPAMLDRLTGELLAASAGEGSVHGASLTTSSLEALKAYLEGRAAHRGGLYNEAAQHFSHALGADSAFTLAAFWRSRASEWGAPVTALERVRVRGIAWDGRSLLNPRDRVLLEAQMGPRGPDTETYADLLRARERAVNALPDQPDAWFLLGEVYLHWGAILGFSDWPERAAQALERAVALDSTWAGLQHHLTQLATRRGDTTEIRRLWQSYVQLDSISDYSDQLRFTAAVALGDEDMRADALDRLAVQRVAGANVAAWFAQTDGGVEYLDTLTAIMRSRARTQRERNSVADQAYAIAMNRGRPREALSMFPSPDADDLEEYMDHVLYWNGFLENTTPVLRRADSTALAPFGPTAREQRRQLGTACRLSRWRLAQGDTSGVASLLQRLETGLTMGDSVVPDGASPLCTSMVRAMLAVRQGSTDAMALVAQVDSILLSFPYQNDYRVDKHLANVMVGGLLEELGELERALAAVRRRFYYWGAPTYLSTQLREEGRLAALTGDREGAVRAYTHYLELRYDPEPELIPEVEAVRTELARLVGEPELSQ